MFIPTYVKFLSFVVMSVGGYVRFIANLISVSIGLALCIVHAGAPMFQITIKVDKVRSNSDFFDMTLPSLHILSFLLDVLP